MFRSEVGGNTGGPPLLISESGQVPNPGNLLIYIVYFCVPKVFFL